MKIEMMPVSEEEAPLKSSMEILSELFGTFNAEPPVIVKKEKDEAKKHKKSKKKHKHKEKKHKKKSKKRKHSASSSSDNSETDLAEILIKKERQSPEKKLKLEPDTDLSISCKKENDKDGVLKDNESNITLVKKIEETAVKPDPDKLKRKEKHKKKHKHRDKKSKSPSRSRENSILKDSSRKDRSKEKHNDDLKHKYDRYWDYKWEEKEHKIDQKCKEKEKHYNDFKNKYKECKNYSFYKDADRYLEKYKLHHDKDKAKKSKEHSASSDRSVSRIDKKKLLEIARKNAIQMMKSGNLPGALNLGPQAQEKVLAAIKSGGKTIEELTDFCKSLSRQEEGELSSVSDENATDSENDMPFHHPFQIKERPSSITMNIKNSVPLPLKSTQERASELRIQFPVSSGQQHRRTENEWVPVSPKKKEASPQPVPKPAETPTPSLPIAAIVAPETSTSTSPAPGPRIFPPISKLDAKALDIASIVSQRLTAMRKLQENPNDSQAISEIYKAQKEMNNWAESKQQIGQFTGSTGANILSQAELNAGYQAWARKDQLQTAAPVSGGMGMHLLQKMGWKPGEGLGKEKTGTLEPLLLEVKLDKKGIVAKEEQKKKQTKQLKGTNKINVQGKHPVSLLGEYASKQKLGAPQYSLCFECGPDHKKNFLFKVTLNGVEYKPNVASPNKKEAKANAASVCLQQMGLLPTV